MNLTVEHPDPYHPHVELDSAINFSKVTLSPLTYQELKSIQHLVHINMCSNGGFHICMDMLVGLNEIEKAHKLKYNNEYNSS